MTVIFVMKMKLAPRKGRKYIYLENQQKQRRFAQNEMERIENHDIVGFVGGYFVAGTVLSKNGK